MTGTPIKVHVTLDQKVRDDPEAREKVLESLVQRTDMTAVNRKRFDRYGIISGVVDADHVKTLRQADFVQSVSVDEERRAI